MFRDGDEYSSYRKGKEEQRIYEMLGKVPSKYVRSVRRKHVKELGGCPINRAQTY